MLWVWSQQNNKIIKARLGRQGLQHWRSRKVKYTVYLFSGMRCIAALSGMPGMMEVYNLAILCCLMRQALPMSSYTRLLLLSFQATEVTCTLQQPKWLLCYLRARPILASKGIVFASVICPRPLSWAVFLSQQETIFKMKPFPLST